MKQRGFTIIELMIVLVLAAVSWLFIDMAMKDIQKMRCDENPTAECTMKMKRGISPDD